MFSRDAEAGSFHSEDPVKDGGKGIVDYRDNPRSDAEFRFEVIPPSVPRRKKSRRIRYSTRVHSRGIIPIMGAGWKRQSEESRTA